MRSFWFLIAWVALPLVLWAALPDLGPGSYYAPAKFVVNFHLVNLPAKITQSDGIAQTGFPTLDQLNREFGIFRIEKMFPGSTPGQDTEPLSGYFVFYFNGQDQARLETVLHRFATLPQIEHVEPVGIHPVDFIPNDPAFENQWFHNQPEDHDLDSPEAWDVARGDTVPIIGIADTGVLYSHPDLATNIWRNWAEWNGLPGVDDDGNGYIDDFRGWDWVNATSGWPGEDYTIPDYDPSDFNGHGTHLAGIVAAISNNGVGGAGISGGSYPSKGARIMPLRIGWSANNQDTEVGLVDMQFAADAIYYAINKGATVINCSWGSSNSGGLRIAVDYAIAGGIVVITSAGNDSNQTAHYLAGRSDVISVANTDPNDVKYSESNFGTWVDVSAPGVSIYSTYSAHYTASYGYMTGTSMSAAMVTGLTAILKSYHPGWNRVQLTWQILHTPDNIDALNPSYQGLLGSGRINVYNALVNTPTPQITLNYPNGNETEPPYPWVVGQTYNITWSSLFLTGNLSIYLNRTYPTGAWERLYSALPNTGSKTWTVQGLPSPTCRIRVQSDNDTTIRDNSNYNFAIGNGTGAPLTLFSDSLDGAWNTDLYNFGDGNSQNGLDYWDNKPQRPHLGLKSCYCAGFGVPSHPPYDNYMDAYFYLKTNCGISLVGYTDVTFSFWIWYSTLSPRDYIRVQYYNNASWVDFPNSNWSGNSGGWVQKTYRLTGITNFRFQFRFVSDSLGTAEGVYVDDIIVTGIPAATDTSKKTCCIVDLSPPNRFTTAPDQGDLPNSTLGDQNRLPHHFGLTQIAPNPCNAGAAISFDLPESGLVSLVVYDPAGREVARLAEGWFTAGPHQAAFDGSRLPTGLYLIRLRVGSLTDTQKLVLLK
jgi:subtilisin family serine protease